MSLTMWPRKDGQLDAVDHLGVRRPRLRELARDATDLHDRHPGGVAQHDRHLQDHLQPVTDPVGGERVEGLGAVARLQEEGPPVGYLTERGGEVAGLAGEDERGEGGELLEAGLERAVVGPRGCCAAGRSRQEVGCPGLGHRLKRGCSRPRVAKP